MSSIIKGQRIRSESTLEIENKNLYLAPEEGDKDLITEESKEGVEKADLSKGIEKAKSNAHIIIEEAKKEAQLEAELILRKAKEESRQESYVTLERAREEGYSEGYQRGELEAQDLIDQAKQIVLDAQAEREQMLSQAEPEIIEMIIAICGKLISEEIKFNKDTILLLVHKALKEVSGEVSDSEISIKISPEEYDYILKNKDLLVKYASDPNNIKILSDINLTKGVCVVETAFGSVKCNIEESFSEVKKQLRLICSKK